MYYQRSSCLTNWRIHSRQRRPKGNRVIGLIGPAAGQASAPIFLNDIRDRAYEKWAAAGMPQGDWRPLLAGGGAGITRRTIIAVGRLLPNESTSTGRLHGRRSSFARPVLPAALRRRLRGQRRARQRRRHSDAQPARPTPSAAASTRSTRSAAPSSASTATPTWRPCPEPIDLAVIATPAPTVPALVADCAARGVPAAIVISAGFSELGAEGRALEAKIRAARGKMRIIGPNCLGVIHPPSNLNASFAAAMAPPGRVALLSQSGAICTSILDWALNGTSASAASSASAPCSTWTSPTCSTTSATTPPRRPSSFTWNRSATCASSSAPPAASAAPST